jgi:CBS domain-containing protein
MVVSEIMTRGVRTVAPGATLREAARIMASEGDLATRFDDLSAGEVLRHAEPVATESLTAFEESV